MNIDPDALGQYDDDSAGDDFYAGLPWNHHSRFDGHPGMVWYAKVRKVRGDHLRVGDCLDTLDHCGHRVIMGIFAGAAPDDQGVPSPERLATMRMSDVRSGLLAVLVGLGQTETVRADVEYDVVDPDSQVTPDGTPVDFSKLPDE